MGESLKLAFVASLTLGIAFTFAAPTSAASSDVDVAKTTATVKKTSSTKDKTMIDVKNKKCPVSGEPVGSMEQGAHVDYNGHRVGLCCNGCKEKFMSAPDKYLEKAQNE